jgi:hypothetical protein
MKKIFSTNIKFIKFGLLLIIFLLPIISKADFDLNQFNANTKEIRRIDNFGTEFYLTVPPTYLRDNYDNISIKIFAFSYFDTKVSVTNDAKSFSETAQITSNNEAIFDVLPAIVFPFSSSTSPFSMEEIYKKSALKIQSDLPISVYVLISGDNQSEGYLALPVSSLGTKYIMGSYIDPNSQVASPINYPAMAGIVNPFDGNQIMIILSNQLKGNIFQKDTIVKVLDKADTWFISLKGKYGDVSGIQVIADKPISLITANQKASVPIDVQPTNYLVEQEFPENTWGNYYHILRLYSRSLNPIIKVFAKDSDTQIYLNSQQIATLNSSTNPTNFIEIRPDVSNPTGDEVISSNKPIAVSVFTTGYTEENNFKDTYKPSRLNILPYEQYSNSLLFNVSNYLINYQNYDINLILVAQINFDGSIPNSLELGFTEPDKSIIWTKLNSLQFIDYKEFNYIFNGKRFAQITLKISKAGNYQIKSDGLFAAYLFSSNVQGTFSFPAGTKLQTLSTNDKIPPEPKWTISCDGTVNGTTADRPDDPGIRSNLTYPIFYSNISTNYDRNFDMIVPGVTSSMNWNLNVRDKNLDANAIITFRDYAGNDTTIEIEYKSPKINISPNLVDFGNTTIGIESLQTVKITNNSDTVIHIKEIKFKYPDSGFKLKNLFQEFDLLAHSDTNITVQFTPTKSGQFEDSLGINNNCFTSFKSKLIARIGDPKIHVTDINFNEITVSTSETKQSTISNIGENPLEIYGFELSDTTNFSVNFGQAVSKSNPLILAPNQTYNFDVTFHPVSEQKFNEQVVVYSNASEIDSICLISAKGIKPGLSLKANNWGNVRYDNSTSPQMLSNADAIILKNTGNTNLTITKVEQGQSSINPNNFIIGLNQIVGKTLKPADEVHLPASFLPVNLGLNQIVLTFTTNLNTETSVILSVFVVIPKVKDINNPINFDTTLVNYPNDEKDRLIEISNLSILNWEYADTLTITDIVPLDAGVVGTNDNSRSGSFYLNLSNIHLPCKIVPGEKLLIPASFAAKDTGLIQARILIKSNAINETQIDLQGYGINRSLTITNQEVQSCLNVPVFSNCSLINNTEETIKIDNVSLSSSDNSFVLTQDYSNGFNLSPKESKMISFKYTPSSFSTQDAQVLVQVNGDNVPSLNANITGKTQFQTLNSYVSPIAQTAQINSITKVKVLVEGFTSEQLIENDKYSVSINFDGNFLEFLQDSIILGNNLDGKFSIENLKVNQYKGTAEFELNSLIGPVEIKSGDLFSIAFKVYLPTNGANSSSIQVKISPINNTCFNFDGNSSNIILLPVCGGDLRQIQIQNVPYYLQGLQANPINANQNINFGVAFDGLTNLSIYNQFGTLCLQPINSFLSQGNYSTELNIENLSSGVYFLIFKSGEFQETKKFIIEK